MAWTTPLTWVAQTFSAAIANAQLRDNMNETAPGIATTGGRLIVTDGANSIAERDQQRAIVSTQETTSSASYTDLATAGPAVTLTTGTEALASVSAQIRHTSTPGLAFVAIDITGATTASPSDGLALAYLGTDTTGRVQMSSVYLVTGLTAGSNTFTLKYKTASGTTRFSNRVISVVAF